MTQQALLKGRLKEEALRLGFLAVGIASPQSLQFRRLSLAQWIEAGHAGGMAYMIAFLDRHKQLLSRVPDLRSIIVLAVSYNRPTATVPSGYGKIARYAQGKDYHKVIHKRLKELESFLQKNAPETFRSVRCVDTNAVQERVLAEMAGLGFYGKNTCLILPQGGSFVFLAALLTNLSLAPDRPIQWNCGECRLCLDACPTQALTGPYQLDARRCISYLTIEHRGPIEPALQPLVHNWLFGCDICQEVCPYNKKAPSYTWQEFGPENGAGGFLDPAEILNLKSQEAFLGRFAGTPLVRAKREGLLRNAAIVAENLQPKG